MSDIKQIWRKDIKPMTRLQVQAKLDNLYSTIDEITIGQFLTWLRLRTKELSMNAYEASDEYAGTQCLYEWIDEL